jgi:hypothetical protein
VTPLARGPACWYFDEGELDVWEVFARAVEQARRRSKSHCGGGPQLVREDLGIGPHRVWWVPELRAADDVKEVRGKLAKVDARTYARPDRTRTIKHRRGAIPDFDTTPGLFTEMAWQLGGEVEPMPWLTLDLSGVAGLAVDVVRAGLAALARSMITVPTDHPVRLRLASLPTGMTVELDGGPAGAVVDVPEGRSQVTLTAAGSP